ncbi:MAG: hypothetical protein R3F02_14755 [Thiolinea sp.]
MKVVFYSLLILLLTVFTQIGGLLLILLLPVLRLIRLSSKWLQTIVRTVTFLLIYTFTVFAIVPPLAALNNRVPLPCFADEKTPLAAANAGYCLLLRNYVTPAILSHMHDVSWKLQRQYSYDSTLYYLDASFPFWDGFPLIPHLSHKDGQKLDLAFYYQHKTTKKPLTAPPSWLGYWFYEQPTSPQDAACQNEKSWLRWDMNWLQAWYTDYEIDEQRTSDLIKLLTRSADKILLEPHLKQRLELNSPVVRFQGCHAARHDDHVHVQWKI